MTRQWLKIVLCISMSITGAQPAGGTSDGTRRVHNFCRHGKLNLRHDWYYVIHRESKKGATLTMAITLSILGQFAKVFHCCKEQ